MYEQASIIISSASVLAKLQKQADPQIPNGRPAAARRITAEIHIPVTSLKYDGYTCNIVAVS
jgi:hypothetical protein